MTEKLELTPFAFPDDLEPGLIDFYKKQRDFGLDELTQHADELSKFVGVYFLFYTGANPLYADIVAANHAELVKPIYVGKAVAKGGRSGNTKQTNSGLYHRLGLHHTSISEAQGLDVQDFRVRVIAMEGAAAVQWAEQTFIRRLQPAWNVAIAGFGIKIPGKGRNKQKVSVWDTLHPGRSLASALTNLRDVNAETPKVIKKMKETQAVDLTYTKTDEPAEEESPEVTPAAGDHAEDTSDDTSEE